MPQTTTVRVRRHTKEAVDRLQSKWHRLRGERLTQQEILDKAVDYVEQHMEAFATEKGWRPWTQKEVDDFFDWIYANTPADGPTDLSQNIDYYLYGWGAEEGKEK